MPKHIDREKPTDPTVRHSGQGLEPTKYQCIKCGSEWRVKGMSTRAGLRHIPEAEQVRMRNEEECPG